MNEVPKYKPTACEVATLAVKIASLECQAADREDSGWIRPLSVKEDSRIWRDYISTAHELLVKSHVMIEAWHECLTDDIDAQIQKEKDIWEGDDDP